MKHGIIKKVLEKLKIVKPQHNYSSNPDGMPKLINFISLSEEEMETLAEEFSEGSSTLKETLLFLWNQGVNTVACCAGHHNDNSKPYVYFKVDNLNDDIIKNILIGLTHCKDVSNVEFSNSYIPPTQSDHSVPAITFRINTTADFSNVLKLLEKSFKEKNNNKFDRIEATFSDDVKQQIRQMMALIDIDLARIKGADLRSVEADIFKEDGAISVPKHVTEKDTRIYSFDGIVDGKSVVGAPIISNKYYTEAIDTLTGEAYYIIVDGEEAKAYTREEVLEKGILNYDEYQKSLTENVFFAINRFYAESSRWYTV